MLPNIDFAGLEKKNGLPPGWLNAVMQTESAGNPDAVSPKGAQGIFQFMPETAKAYGIDPLDPVQAADGAARMYGELFKQYGGDQDKALAAYNWGSGNMQKHGMDKMPEETRNYIGKVKSALGAGGKQYAAADTVATDASYAPADLEAEMQRRGLAPAAGNAPAVDGGPSLDEIKQEMERRNRTTNQNKGMGERFAGGLKQGMAKRGVGLIQLLDDISGHNYLSDSEREAIPSVLEELRQSGEGTGLTGFFGEMLGDPVSYVGGGSGSMLKAGIKVGAAAGASAPVDSKDSTIGARAVNTGVGATLGGATGVILPAVGSKLGSIAQGITDRVLAAGGSKNAAQRIVYRNYAEKLLNDGLTPEKVEEAVKKATASGLDPTLAEATGSRGLRQYESKLAGGSGSGATAFNEHLATRGSQTIPGAMEGKANKLIGQPGAVDDAYARAAQEGAQTQAAELDAVTEHLPNGGKIIKQYEIDDKLRNGLAGIRSSIGSRLEQLGQVNNIESASLAKAKNILDNAERRGGTFEAMLDAKKQLDDIYIDGADMNSQKAASRFVAQHTKSLNDILQELAPTAYPAAKQAAKSRMVGNDLLDAARGKDAVKDVGALVNSPDMKAEFLSKLPDAATRDQYTAMFDVLDKIGRGFGGKSRNPAIGTTFEGDMAGVLPSRTSPLMWAPAATRAVAETFLPKVYEEAASASMKPNTSRLVEQMTSQNADASPLSKLFLGALANQTVTKGTTPGADAPANPNAPGDGFSPMVGAILRALGAGGTSEPPPKRKGIPEIYISKDPNIGPDGLPRLDLPKY